MQVSTPYSGSGPTCCSCGFVSSSTQVPHPGWERSGNISFCFGCASVLPQMAIQAPRMSNVMPGSSLAVTSCSTRQPFICMYHVCKTKQRLFCQRGRIDKELEGLSSYFVPLLWPVIHDLPVNKQHLNTVKPCQFNPHLPVQATTSVDWRNPNISVISSPFIIYSFSLNQVVLSISYIP